jgi:hypothetical protein
VWTKQSINFESLAKKVDGWPFLKVKVDGFSEQKSPENQGF